MKVPILLPNIFNYPFTYESNLNLKVGDYVLIPFGKLKITGVVWNEFESENKKNFLIKKVISKLNIPPLNEKTIDFLNRGLYYEASIELLDSLICSFRNVVAPTVSASSGSFSSPTLMAVR